MTDVVWMRLTALSNNEERMETFLFGTKGITRFRASDDGQSTLLLDAVTDNVIAVVKEDEETIFDFIAKIRGFRGNSKPKKTKSKSRTSKR